MKTLLFTHQSPWSNSPNDSHLGVLVHPIPSTQFLSPGVNNPHSHSSMKTLLLRQTGLIKLTCLKSCPLKNTISTVVMESKTQNVGSTKDVHPEPENCDCVTPPGTTIFTCFRVQLDPPKAYSLKVCVPSVTLRGGVTFIRWDLVRCNWVTGDVILNTDDAILIGPQLVPTP